MNKVDRKILLTVLGLVFSGIFIFLSASLTYLKDPNQFFKIFSVQIIAIILGLIFIYLIQKNKYINYLSIKNNSIYFFIGGLILQLMVLLPGVGLTLNGSTRWIDIGFIALQPSELFRFAAILFIANIFFIFSKKLKNFSYLIKFTILPTILAILFYYFIHDLGSLMILMVSIFAMLLFTEVNKIKLLTTSFFVVIILFSTAWYFLPHVQQRISNFIWPERADIQGSFYQNYNMMSAIGSGQIDGVGYGESLQKFNGSIPEAISDSIFSIYAEEWGFIGSIILILTLLFLTYAIFTKIKYIKNRYQKYVVVGLGVNLIFPAFYNIAASVALVPLSGIPLTFISKGGTSIFFALTSIGIILLFIRK